MAVADDVIPGDADAAPARVLDCTGLICPLPVLRARKALAALPSAAILEVRTTDPGAPRDMRAYCQEAGHALLSVETVGAVSVFRIARG